MTRKSEKYVRRTASGRISPTPSCQSHAEYMRLHALVRKGLAEWIPIRTNLEQAIDAAGIE